VAEDIDLLMCLNLFEAAPGEIDVARLEAFRQQVSGTDVDSEFLAASSAPAEAGSVGPRAGQKEGPLDP